MMRADFVHQQQRLIAAACSGFIRSKQQLIRGLAHRGHNYDWAAMQILPDDTRNTRNCFLRFDGSAAELHDNHGGLEQALGNHEFCI
jgi:hypothetical protein